MRHCLFALPVLLGVGDGLRAAPASAGIVDQECRVVVICDEDGRCPYYVVCEPIED